MEPHARTIEPVIGVPPPCSKNRHIAPGPTMAGSSHGKADRVGRRTGNAIQAIVAWYSIAAGLYVFAATAAMVVHGWLPGISLSFTQGKCFLRGFTRNTTSTAFFSAIAIRHRYFRLCRKQQVQCFLQFGIAVRTRRFDRFDRKSLHQPQ
jgi:hypothetical protein